jgi:copper homeostasis protein (lipoprotein)
MKRIFLLTAVLIISFMACKQQKSTQLSAVDSHTTKTSVDWAGVYTATLPCADCEAIKATMRLNNDLTFSYDWRYLGKEDSFNQVRGDFSWNDDGNSITLAFREKQSLPTFYAVGENVLVQRDLEGNPIDGELADMYTFTKKETPALEGSWKLTELNGNAIPGDRNLSSEPFLKISINNMRINGNGSCNNFFGSIEMLEENKIRFSEIGATKMACEEMITEKEFFEALGNTDSFSLKGDTLILLQEQTSPLAKFAKSDQ